LFRRGRFTILNNYPSMPRLAGLKVLIRRPPAAVRPFYSNFDWLRRIDRQTDRQTDRLQSSPLPSVPVPNRPPPPRLRSRPAPRRPSLAPRCAAAATAAASWAKQKKYACWAPSGRTF
jgi:hypothetical protein